MSASDYKDKVFEFQDRLTALIRCLTEAQKIISPCHKDRETFPGLIDGTPKAKQRELLNNAWIVLRDIDDMPGFGSDIGDLFELLEGVGNCPIEPEPEFQGHPVGK